MIKWKIVVGSAGFGLLLSLLTGAISGVPFGTLLVRAILWGVVFGCVGGGLSYLISRYLPELLAIAPAGPQEDQDRGRNVDIVLPDENPHADQLDDDVTGDAEPDELDERGTTLTRSGEDSGEGVSTSLVEEVEELGAAEESEERHPFRSAERAGNGTLSSEELPDLDDGDTLFSHREGTASNGDYDDISSFSGGRPGAETPGVGADPEDVAKAIRTVLKRDQKG